MKQEETEVMWLLAEKLKAKGFPNLFDYYSKEFKDPETGKTPGQRRSSSPRSRPRSPARRSGCPRSRSRATHGRRAGTTSARRACVSGPKYTLKKGWGGKFATATKKFEFYSETLKKGLLEHAKKYETTIDDILAVSGYVARGELAFVPHYEPPKRHGSVQDYPFTFVDYKSRLNREGRSAEPALVPGVQEGRPGRRRPGTTCSR